MTTNKNEVLDVTSELKNLEIYGAADYDKIFKINGDCMSGKNINDTPKGATVYTREISIKDVRVSKYGNIIATNDTTYFADIISVNLKDETITCRNRADSSYTLSIGDINHVYEVVTRGNI